MRGQHPPNDAMFSYVTPEARVGGLPWVRATPWLTDAEGRHVVARAMAIGGGRVWPDRVGPP
jgi:hypothetical protein